MSSLPPPIPIAPLEYRQNSGRGRPGIMTAVGVMSIVIGGLGGLFSLVGVVSAISMMALSRMPMTMPVVPPTPAISSDVVTVNGITVDADGSSDGMDESQRQKVIQAITLVQPVTSIQRRHLDLLLKNSGAKIFAFVNESTSVEEIRDKLTASTSETVGGLSYINMPSGVIRISDNHAAFQPSGAGDSVQAMAGPANVSATTQAVTANTVSLRMSMAGSTLSLIESLASLVVAVILLVGGICLLGNLPKYSRFHWIYIVVKIPLACMAAVASWLTYSTMMRSISSTMPPGSALPIRMDLLMLIPSLIWALIVISYPIALIFVLRSRSAKAYNADLRGLGEELAIPFDAIN